MNFVRNGIVDSLIEQINFFNIKYDLFHDVIAIVKFTIFKLKTINIYILKLFYNPNFKSILNQTYIFPTQPQLKVLFIKQLFSNHNHNIYRNTKHTLNLMHVRFYNCGLSFHSLFTIFFEEG